MRNHLVTCFRCTDCGGFLELAYEPKEGVETPWQSDDITGAAKVEKTFYIEPCRGCVGEARKPLELMRTALASIAV